MQVCHHLRNPSNAYYLLYTYQLYLTVSIQLAICKQKEALPSITFNHPFLPP